MLLSLYCVQVRNSNELWVLEAQTGILCHDGETGEIMTHTAQDKDVYTLIYNGDNNTLAIGYNDEVTINEWSSPLYTCIVNCMSNEVH